VGDYTPLNVKAFDWEMNREDFYKKYFSKYDLIKTFKAGDSFGEIALHSGGSRTGTMICKEDTYLLTLDK
jgi:CRP-like cAMP-binding protein